MNRRLTIILFCAFVVATGASYVVYRLVGKELSVRAKSQTARVALAARELQIGTLIKATDLKMGEVVGEPPVGAITSLDAAVGRGVVSTLYAGEPVIEKRLAPAGSGGGLAATIPPGMRACAVRVDEVVGVAGFVVPGMRVDVIVSGNDPAPGQNEMKAKTLLQNLQVLSAGTNIQKDNEGKPVQVQVVNLLVTLEQAEVLSLASNQTRIQLVLRNPLDTEMSKTSGSEMSGLFGAPPPKPKAPVPHRTVLPAPVAKPEVPKVWVVELINGAKQTKQSFY
jgi:pilus assembly protein CpaB